MQLVYCTPKLWGISLKLIANRGERINRDKRDNLTGLYMRGIMDELDHQFSGVSSNSTWSLSIIDIDHFKLVNDVFGHLEGDGVIRRVANVLARNRRSTDTVLRYGGDEFVIVMPDTSQLKAVNNGERILRALEREVFPEGMDIGLSIGVAESKPSDLHLADVLKRADEALYEAKKSGRGRVSFYQDREEKTSGKEISFEHFVGRGVSFKNCLSLEARCMSWAVKSLSFLSPTQSLNISLPSRKMNWMI